MIVPDSIEPYYGFKWLYTNNDGLLSSQYGHQAWPDDGPMVAHCIRNWGEEWRPVPSVMAKPKVVYASHTSSGYSGLPPSQTTGWVIYPGQQPREFTGSPDLLHEDARTSIILPPGFAWSWETKECPHDLSPDADCTCGIYAVRKPDQCSNYRRGDSVLVKVALWGKVIPGTDGARGQFAYPVEVLDSEGGVHFPALVKKRYLPEPEPIPESPPAPVDEKFQTSVRSTNWRDKLGL